MYNTLSAKMFAALTPDRRANLCRRIALREQVVRKADKDAHHHLANGFMSGRRLTANDHAALTRIARSGDRAIRVLGRFHDLMEAASHNALRVA
jgi:hypothetical protein